MNRSFSRSCGSYDPRVSPAGAGDDGRDRPDRRNVLRKLIGKCVCINLVGDDTVKGKLIAVCRGYLVLQTKHGVVYVNANQVESIEEAGSDRGSRRRPRFIRALDFRDLVEQFEDEFVKITWGREDKVKGFVSDVSGNRMTLIADNRIVVVFIDKIKTIQPISARDRLGHCSLGDRTSGNRTAGSGASSDSALEQLAPGALQPGVAEPGGIGMNWAVGETVLPEPVYRPNRYGVPKELLLAGNRKKRKAASKPKLRKAPLKPTR
ncbi:hypothetical protein ACFSL6_05595 [Paenibacillus thailandensis]|uniref:DUF2642 domain-containing protein n=1 Tax=Paenibacillus thailandensis TaxID=393250 RepID=A0ABW5QV19_9BACL